MLEDEYQPLLYRDKLIVEVKQFFSNHLQVLRDVTNYGTALFPRCLLDNKETLKDLVVITVLFHQILAMLDGLEVLLSSGAVYASNLQLRAIFEAAVCLKWILKEDGENKARHYYVYNLRRQRTWACRLIPGSPEASEFGKPPGSRTRSELEDLQKIAQEQVRAIDEHLATPAFAMVNQRFEALRKQYKHEVPWHRPLGFASFRRIAIEVKKLREYIVIYGGGSEVMHASNYKHHIKIGQGDVEFEPIRHLQEFGIIFSYSLSTVFDVYREMLTAYRPGELALFDKKYTGKWRATFLNIPKVKYEYEHVRL
jgi:Family of unknown function (DUF5677)